VRIGCLWYKAKYVKRFIQRIVTVLALAEVKMLLADKRFNAKLFMPMKYKALVFNGSVEESLFPESFGLTSTLSLDSDFSGIFYFSDKGEELSICS